MKQFSLLHPLLLSFYSKDLYRDVYQNWKGIGFTYLFVLILITTPILIYEAGAFFNQAEWRNVPQEEVEGAPTFEDFINQIPPITIENGELSSPVSQPYVLRVGMEGIPVLMVDTTGTYNTLDDVATIMPLELRDEGFVPGLATKTYITFYNKNKHREETYYFEEFADAGQIYFDAAIIANWIDIFFERFKIPTIIIIYIFAALGLFLFRIIQMLIYGLFGMVLGFLLGVRIDYADIVRLASVAITPVVIISLIVGKVTPLGQNPFDGLPAFAVAMCYLGFALRSVKGISKTPPAPPEQVEENQ